MSWRTMRACQHPWSLSARHCINHGRVTLVSSEQRNDSCWMPSDVISAASSCSQRGSTLAMSMLRSTAQTLSATSSWSVGLIRHRQARPETQGPWRSPQAHVGCIPTAPPPTPDPVPVRSRCGSAVHNRPELGRHWFRDLGIEVHVVTLDDETRQRVQNAQSRQYR